MPDGSEFGVLMANGKWGITPHSLQVRKQINKLRKLKILHFTNYDDPIECYHRYLQEQSKTSRSDRNRLAALQRSKKKDKEKVDFKEVLPDDTQSENVVPLIEVSTKKSMNIIENGLGPLLINMVNQPSPIEKSSALSPPRPYVAQGTHPISAQKRIILFIDDAQRLFEIQYG
ncbi:hypothetical protein [Paenibacillus sp. PL91]|uniref:hypothetical protein n=1 Tax=Paenibacillus sp. PL91 TaxID=2729538 RepID=UPI00145F9AB1|nr:hypothetical protein [Paenibacillus sp. PL91]MBC9203742.1 hypothetical protein [Paenibacillus sp. PL91]